MYDLLDLTLCKTAQLYVETRRMRCCEFLLPFDLQGSQCLLGCLGLTHLLDVVKLVGWPFGGEAWGRYLVPTPVAPCLHPIVQKLVLSHAQSLSPVRVHLVHLIPVNQKNQPIVWSLLHLFACDVPPTESVVVALPSHVGTTLVLSGVASSTHATPSLLLPFSSYPSTFAWFACHTVASSIE